MTCMAESMNMTTTTLVRLVQPRNPDVVLAPAPVSGSADPGLVDLVYSANVVVIIESTEPSVTSVRLDGQPRWIGAQRPAVIPLDLTRSVGYHRLEISNSEFWFATEDAKLRLEGVIQMLTALRSSGQGWTGQMIFSDGSGLRDEHVVFSWLERRADKTISACAAVLAAPIGRQRLENTVSRRGGAGVDVPATLRLLRSDPTRYLEPREPGILTVEGTAYVPLRVVHHRRTTTMDTIPNRRAVWALARLRQLVSDVLGRVTDKQTRSRCWSWQTRIDSVLAAPLAAQLARYVKLAPDRTRQALEFSDVRYGKAFDEFSEMSDLFGWTPTRRVGTRFSAVQYSDQIYQAYAATVLAEALGLRQNDSVLGANQPAFSGKHHDLYLDTPPPGSVLQSWRADADPPDESRPDILVHDRATGQVALLDAKYRIDPTTRRATEDSRKEVAAYMALYGLTSAGIVFPGPFGPRDVAGHGQRIREIGIAPGQAIDPQTVRDAVAALLQAPVFPLQQRHQLI